MKETKKGLVWGLTRRIAFGVLGRLKTDMGSYSIFNLKVGNIFMHCKKQSLTTNYIAGKIDQTSKILTHWDTILHSQF